MTRIAIGGITVITAALVILLSTFNGIESMIEQLYSDFDPDISIKPTSGKTFYESELSKKELSAISGVKYVTRMIEEVVVVKHEQKWVNANLIGVEEPFLSGTKMSTHIIEGQGLLNKNASPRALVGARLFDQLDAYIPQEVGEEQFVLYAPKREAKIRLGSSPFSAERIAISGRFDFNKEVNSQAIVVPFQFAHDLLRYNEELTGYGIFIADEASAKETKERIQVQLGSQFEVKTSLEKNALIFKTSQSEKIIVIVILLFVFVLASFNLVASLTMIFLEKKENIQTLIHLGANRITIERMFFIEGMLIAGRGIVFGLLIGYVTCFSQLQFGWLTMPGTDGQAFPIVLSFVDGLVILLSVGFLSIFFSYFPVRSLIKKNFGSIRF